MKRVMNTLARRNCHVPRWWLHMKRSRARRVTSDLFRQVFCVCVSFGGAAFIIWCVEDENDEEDSEDVRCRPVPRTADKSLAAVRMSGCRDDAAGPVCETYDDAMDEVLVNSSSSIDGTRKRAHSPADDDEDADVISDDEYALINGSPEGYREALDNEFFKAVLAEFKQSPDYATLTQQTVKRWQSMALVIAAARLPTKTTAKGVLNEAILHEWNKAGPKMWAILRNLGYLPKGLTRAKFMSKLLGKIEPMTGLYLWEKFNTEIKVLLSLMLLLFAQLVNEHASCGT